MKHLFTLIFLLFTSVSLQAQHSVQIINFENGQPVIGRRLLPNSPKASRKGLVHEADHALTAPANNGRARLAVATSETISYSGSIVTYTVPAGVSSLTIEARGGQGGDSPNDLYRSGLGAIITGTVVVSPGQQLKVLVGQQLSSGNGGGGGTFVTKMDNTPLIIAGGGGGSGMVENLIQKQGQSGQSGANGTGIDAGTGGAAGNGGQTSNTFGYSSYSGGGLLTDASGGIGSTGFGNGKSFIKGGVSGILGGFGGGGFGAGSVSGGGGGGYSGGGHGGHSLNTGGVGGGGGSYNIDPNGTNLAGANSGNGAVIISYAICTTITPTLTASNNGVLTCTNPTLSLQAGGGASGATYRFSGPGLSQSGTGATASATQKGDYTVTISGENGCPSGSKTIIVEENKTPPQNVQLTPSGTLTQNNPSATLTATSNATAGVGVSYVFSPLAQKTGSNQATVTSSGTYTVTAKRDDNGCTASATTTVLGANSPTVCRNGTATINLTTAGSPVRYEWYLNAPLGSVLRDGAFYAGATTASLTVINIQQTSIYYAKVYYADGSTAAYGPFRVNVNLNCNGRIGVIAEAGAELRITLLGNPLQGEALRALVEGATGQRLHVELLDVSGRPLRSQVFESAESAQAVEWNLNTAGSGLYLLQAVSGQQRNSTKVIKP